MAGYLDWNDTRRAANTPVSAPNHQGLQPAQQAATAGQQAYGMGRAAQQDVYGMLQSNAAGRGPSVAQQQLQAGAQSNLVNQMGMAAQARGGSLASQQRAAQGMGSAAAMGLNRDAGMMRAQEMQAAQAALTGQANTMAGMDLQQMLAAQQALQGVTGQMYGTEAQIAEANRQAAMEQQQRNRAFGMQLGQMGMGAIAGLGSTMMLPGMGAGMGGGGAAGGGMV
jgi:hypothetical protein